MVSGIRGVLVAGGAGRRLTAGNPSGPKALLPLGGMTLLERAARTLAGACDDLVVAAPAARALELPAGIRTRDGRAPRLVHDHPGSPGPLAGMVAGLAAGPVSPAFARALVLGVDFPFMEPAFLDALIECLGRDQAVVPRPGGVAQPLAAAYAPEAVAILAACHAGGEHAPTQALGSLAVRWLDDAALERMPGGSGCLFNLNTPDDLEDAERRMAARAKR